MARPLPQCLLIVLFFWSLSCSIHLNLDAQVEGITKDYLFENDDKRFQDAQDKRYQSLLVVDKGIAGDVDFKAPNIEFNQETNTLKGTGGVVLSFEGSQIQCDEASYNQETQDAGFNGKLLYTYPEGRLAAEDGDFSLKTQTGEFSDALLSLEETLFRAKSGRLYKDSEFEYRAYDTSFTTCDCPDGGWPWSIECNQASIEEGGYAKTYGTTLDLYGIPVLYTPYLTFPVRNQRYSGVMPPTFGYSQQNGMQLSIPYYAVIDDYSDLTVTPFTLTSTRTGSEFEYRGRLSTNHQIDGKFIYSDESARDGQLRGTSTQGVNGPLYDPSIDTNRFGMYYKEMWRSESSALFPSSFIADIHYVSDNLFLREFNDSDIGLRTTRFTTSRLLLSTNWNQYLNSEVSGEYNQAIETDNNITFQRYPEIQLVGQKTFSPFGQNPLGFKLLTKTTAKSTTFRRQEGFDGNRYDITPEIRAPHHYKNYLNGEFSFRYNQTYYNLNNDFKPYSTDQITGDERGVYTAQYKVGTAVEKVYNVSDDSFLRYVTSLGSRNQSQRLRRIKNIIEPSVAYSYTPYENQDLNPFFDATDRIRQRDQISAGVRSSFLGRFLPKYVGSDEVVELTPDIQDLPTINAETPLPLAAEGPRPEYETGKSQVIPGEIREIAMFGVRQNFDRIEARQDNDPNRSAWSDIAFDLGLYPTRDFGMYFTSNLDPETFAPSSWSLTSSLRDDRGDIFRGRYTFIDNNLSQVEGNLEVVLNEQLRLGFYGRFDEVTSKFIESRTALRFQNSCKCWGVDIGVSETVNPNNQQVFVTFNFNGLGGLIQKFNNSPKN